MTIDIVAITDKDEEFGNWVEALIDGTAEKLGYPFDPVPFNLKAVDAEGRPVGGLTAHAVQGWLFIKLLGLTEQSRGKGAGRRLLAQAEDFARQKGLFGVYLDTFEFQAPGFYEKLGYKECGRLPARDGAKQRIWLAKVFDEPDDEKPGQDRAGS